MIVFLIQQLFYWLNLKLIVMCNKVKQTSKTSIFLFRCWKDKRKQKRAIKLFTKQSQSQSLLPQQKFSSIELVPTWKTIKNCWIPKLFALGTITRDNQLPSTTREQTNQKLFKKVFHSTLLGKRRLGARGGPRSVKSMSK